MNKMFLKDKAEIKSWLKNQGIYMYDLQEDEKYVFVINAHADIVLIKKSLNFIPVKFNIVNGGFYCSKNNLTSLEFSPIKVGDDFDCSYNALESLEYAPEHVGGFFGCSNNKLKNLIHIPGLVRKLFICRNNEELGDLQSIENFSKIKEESQRQKIEMNIKNLEFILPKNELSSEIIKSKI